MNKLILTIFSFVVLPLSLGGCNNSPSSVVSQYSEAVSRYENCLAQEDNTCASENKKSAISLYSEIEDIDLDDANFFSALDFNRNERNKRLRNEFNAARVKMIKALFADGDYNQAGTFYYKTKFLFSKHDSLIMLGDLVKNIHSVSDKNKQELVRIADSYNMPYESFLISLSYENYPYYAPSEIISLLEKYNCYSDAALMTNYFAKVNNDTYNTIRDKYQEIMNSLTKEQISSLNQKTRELIKNDHKPSLSSDCELNFYKKLK